MQCNTPRYWLILFELIYDSKYSNKKYEYYDIYKDGKHSYKVKEANFVLSFKIDRHKKTIQFINVTDDVINEILPDIHELYQTILSLYDELGIEGYEVSGDDLLSNELDCVLECNNLK